MRLETNKMIVLIGGGAIIGAGLGLLGLNITMPLWWFIDIPAILFISFNQENIWNFFASIPNIFKAKKKYI